MKAGHVRQRSPGSFELRWRAGGKIRTTLVGSGCNLPATSNISGTSCRTAAT